MDKRRMVDKSVTELLARPLCARCGRLVERFEEVEIFGMVRFTAACHGERESIDLRPNEARGLNFGMAFVAPRILSAARE